MNFSNWKYSLYFEHWTRLWSANRVPRFSIKDWSRHPVGKRNISAKTVSQSFIFLVVERCYLLCNVLPTVYVTRMQILHQYLKVNKQHAQFSNKQTMTMISASDFLSKFFSKMRKLCTKPGSSDLATHSCDALYPWLSQKMTFSKLSKEQDWTQHRVLRIFF